MADTVTITPLRLAWLRKLAADGPTAAMDMPKNRNGQRVNELIWGPLKTAGFMVSDGVGCWAITDTGRAVLAKALRVAANQGTPVDAEWPATKGENDA